MKAIILAGGLGSRLSEETLHKPKPMVEIGGKPMLWHIMKLYSQHGINDFVVCCGYKGYLIKEYFANYFMHQSDVTFDLANNRMEVHERYAEPWRVTLVDTGDSTQTGGRMKRVRRFVEDDEAFCFTYGDGVGDIDISATLDFHRSHGKWATMSCAAPPGRFGAVQLEGSAVRAFKEKPETDGAVVNAGFFVLSPRVFDLIESDSTAWELQPMEALARAGQLEGYRHTGFWQPMDTLRDKNLLEELWRGGRAPWRVWE